jgi:hypothetical protein
MRTARSTGERTARRYGECRRRGEAKSGRLSSPQSPMRLRFVMVFADARAVRSARCGHAAINGIDAK